MLLPGLILLLLPLALLFGGLHYQSSLPVLSPSQLVWYNYRAETVTVYVLTDDVSKFRDTYTLLELQTSLIQPQGAAQLF